MKLAKKALVVLLAAMFVLSMSVVMASAAATYEMTQETVEIDGKEYLEVRVYLLNAIGQQGEKLVVKYDPDVLEIADSAYDVAEGDDAMLAYQVIHDEQKYLGQPAANVVGEVTYGYTTSLPMSADTMKGARGKDLGINFDRFNLLIIDFTVVDDTKATTITLTDGKEATYASLKVGSDKAAEEEASRKAAEEESSRKAAEEASKAAEESKKAEEASKAAEESKKAEEASKAAEESKKAEEASRRAAEESKKNEESSKKDENPSAEEPSKEDTSKKDETPSKDDTKKDDTKKDDTKKNDSKSTTKAPQADGGVNGGDNMALAAAFGVVALAGAALVITKKRK